jgi:hypothetical protein
MLKKLLLSIIALFTITFISNSPAHVFASTFNNYPNSQFKSNAKENLPLNTPLLFRGFDYNTHFLGYLGLTVKLNWDARPWNYLYMDTYKEIYLEDAGHGKVYMKSGKADWEGYEYVGISTRGYLYLGTKNTAEAFTVTSENDPINPGQKLYEFFDSHYRGIGVYDNYITVGRGTIPTAWKIITQP